MNRHFSDARYYFRRGFDHLYTGLKEESEPLRRRIMKAMGREMEEEEIEPQSRRERVEYGARRAATRGRRAARKVRRRVERTE
ncbi:hypothetical protein C453_15873 [Haloferax elongans ATCC BAA-1513]|uniref:Uncharacterized protein n=1 Tax=Haloferax elongans ATCC BAA-1513 TaxID=1230453 RepID=M0HFM1_HALEO|nr:hypothetical protein [Haloferax elongans]ELZ82578.1 hypothetical protein C453_15873 [Haloferax elongans ATCC BAA-1513]